MPRYQILQVGVVWRFDHLGLAAKNATLRSYQVSGPADHWWFVARIRLQRRKRESGILG